MSDGFLIRRGVHLAEIFRFYVRGIRIVFVIRILWRLKQIILKLTDNFINFWVQILEIPPQYSMRHMMLCKIRTFTILWGPFSTTTRSQDLPQSILKLKWCSSSFLKVKNSHFTRKETFTRNKKVGFQKKVAETFCS